MNSLVVACIRGTEPHRENLDSCLCMSTQVERADYPDLFAPHPIPYADLLAFDAPFPGSFGGAQLFVLFRSPPRILASADCCIPGIYSLFSSDPPQVSPADSRSPPSIAFPETFFLFAAFCNSREEE